MFCLLTGLALLLYRSTVSGEVATLSDNSSGKQYSNHLIDENSPYLLSHAHNPVDWYPWGDEALEKAKREDKPIFLSIGYAACHWCHVMERESFENEEIAAFLNRHFVSIKVDREQRPDLDHIYMTFTQVMSGGGGWPMTVFLTPDLKPFFAGTYFPPDDNFGRPGFRKVINEIASAYRDNREQLYKSSREISEYLTAQLNADSPGSILVSNMIARGAVGLMGSFDHTLGGFGRAPKFPHATELRLFLRYSQSSGDRSFLAAAEKALRAMARGGIYDQLGGGFARYSTDERWLVPHFEKMLYDNALLVPVYADAFQITGDESYRETVRGTLDFILREMTDRAGGFYSALDADSEGEEGKFYVWSKKEIEVLLGNDAALFCAYYNVTSGGNFEGGNILHVTDESEETIARVGAGGPGKIASMRQKLLDARAARVRPLTDDKILTSWNGLAVEALCLGYQVSGDQRYLEAAKKNAAFVESELFRDGRLTHSYREGRHSEGLFLEDYAYYLSGLVELYQSDYTADNRRWLRLAELMADRAIGLFMDEKGSLYLRDAGRPDLIMRPRDEADGALPAAGSCLISALFRLGRLTSNNAYTQAAERGLRALSGLIDKHPASMASALLALDYHFSDKIEIVIIGDGPARDALLTEVHRAYVPNRLLAVGIDPDRSLPLFEGRTAEPGQAVAFVCRNSACRLPVATADELKRELAAVSSATRK